jgi:hypothetical protein
MLLHGGQNMTRKINFTIATLFTTGLLFVSPINKASGDDVTAIQPVTDPIPAVSGITTTLQDIQDKIDSATATLQSNSQTDGNAILSIIQNNNPNVDTKTAIDIATTQEPIASAISDASSKVQIAQQTIDSATVATQVAQNALAGVDSQTAVVTQAQLNIDSATVTTQDAQNTLDLATSGLSSFEQQLQDAQKANDDAYWAGVNWVHTVMEPDRAAYEADRAANDAAHQAAMDASAILLATTDTATNAQNSLTALQNAQPDLDAAAACTEGSACVNYYNHNALLGPAHDQLVAAQNAADTAASTVVTAQASVDSATLDVANKEQALTDAANNVIQAKAAADASSITVTTNGITATVYSGTGRTPAIPSANATPILTTTVPQIAFNWGSGSVMGGPSDRVIVKFEGTITVPNDAVAVKYAVSSDDGSRMYIDGQLAIDNWRDQGTTWSPYSAIYNTTTNKQQNFVIWYYENGGGATCTLGWMIYRADGTAYFTTPGASAFGATTTTQDPALVNAYNNAIIQADKAKQAVIDAKSTLDLANQTLLTAQSDVVTANQAITDAQAAYDTELAIRNAAWDSYTAALSAANAGNQAIANAQSVYDQAMIDLTNAQANLTNAQALDAATWATEGSDYQKLVDDYTNLSAIENARPALQQSIIDAQAALNAQQNLIANYQENVRARQEDLTNAQQVLETEQQNLISAQNAAQLALQTANSLADSATVAVQDASLATKNAVNVTQDYYTKIAQDKAAADALAAKQAADKAAADKALADQQAADAKAAADKAAADKAAADAAAREQEQANIKAQAEAKAAAEAAAKAEADAKAAQEAKDLADKQAADAKAAADKAAADALAAQKAAEEKAAQDAADAKAKADQDAANAKAEADAKAAAQAAADQAAKDKADAEAKAKQDAINAKALADKLAAEAAAKDQAAKDAKAAADKAAADKAAADKAAADALAAQKAIGVVPNNPNQLSDTVVKVAPAEVLVPHVQVDKPGVENGGIEFFGTKSAPQVVGEDGKLTPAAPAPGSGLPIPADAITTQDTFIGQPGGTTFNAPDIAVPVIETPVTGAIASVPGVQALNHAFVAMANIGNDMSPVTRKKAKKILVLTIAVAAIRRRFN